MNKTRVVPGVVAIKRGDKPTAQGLLAEIEETVKALEALITK